jgi:hypothetical protein
MPADVTNDNAPHHLTPCQQRDQAAHHGLGCNRVAAQTSYYRKAVIWAEEAPYIVPSEEHCDATATPQLSVAAEVR